MTLMRFISELQDWADASMADGSASDVKFVGIKWQDEHHPSAEEFPIEFVSCSDGGTSIKVKFITKPHNK